MGPDNVSGVPQSHEVSAVEGIWPRSSLSKELATRTRWIWEHDLAEAKRSLSIQVRLYLVPLMIGFSPTSSRSYSAASPRKQTHPQDSHGGCLNRAQISVVSIRRKMLVHHLSLHRDHHGCESQLSRQWNATTLLSSTRCIRTADNEILRAIHRLAFLNTKCEHMALQLQIHLAVFAYSSPSNSTATPYAISTENTAFVAGLSSPKSAILTRLLIPSILTRASCLASVNTTPLSSYTKPIRRLFNRAIPSGSNLTISFRNETDAHSCSSFQPPPWTLRAEHWAQRIRWRQPRPNCGATS